MSKTENSIQRNLLIGFLYKKVLIGLNPKTVEQQY